MRRVAAVIGGIVLGYALAGVVIALTLWTPFGKLSEPFWGEAYITRETPLGTEINLPFILGSLLMGGAFSAGFYGVLKKN